MRTIAESDWKKLRSLKTRVLNQACGRILDAAAQVLENREGREHDAYMHLWKLLKKEDKLIALMFDDLRRSTAFYKLAHWHQNGLLTESELASFTEETQAIVRFFNQSAPK